VTKRKRPPLTARDIGLLAAISLCGLAVVAGLIWANARWSALVSGGDKFFTLYSGARAFLFQSGDPYGRESAISAMELARGGFPAGEIDALRLTLPFFLMPFIYPFAVVPDPALARGLWAFLAQLALAATVLLALRLAGSTVPRGLVVGCTVLMLFNSYVVVAVLEGTPAALLGLAYVGVLWALQTDQDELAGALCALCLCMWEVGLPFLGLVTWRVFHQNRRRVIAGFGMALVVLLGFSFLLFPGWLLPFLTANIGVLRSAPGTSTAEVLLRLSPDHGMQISRGITIVVLATMIYEWAVGRESDNRRHLWIAFLALAATPLIGLRIELSNLVVLTPGLVLILAAALQRRRFGAWFGALLLTVVMVVPWYLAWRGFAVGDQRARDVGFLFLPLVSLVGLYWTRWWFLRPARTWLDEIRALER